MASSQIALKKDLELLSPAVSPSWGEDKLWMLTEGWAHMDFELQLHEVWSSFKLCFQGVPMHVAWKFCSQVFVQIKSLHMNMQESNHQGMLLAKLIKICE